MGYTHYFKKTASLDKEQIASLCENAAKIVTYWFDHTANAFDLFASKDEHQTGLDDYLEKSRQQLKIFSSVSKREEALCHLWIESNEIFLCPSLEKVPSESFNFPFNEDAPLFCKSNYFFCKTNYAESFGYLVFGLFYFLEIFGLGQALTDGESEETEAGRKLVETVFPEVVKDYSKLAIKPYQEQILSDALQDWNLTVEDGHKVCLVYQGCQDIGSNLGDLEFEVDSFDDLISQVMSYVDNYDLNRFLIEQVELHGNKTDVAYEFQCSERYRDIVLSDLCEALNTARERQLL